MRLLQLLVRFFTDKIIAVTLLCIGFLALQGYVLKEAFFHAGFKDIQPVPFLVSVFLAALPVVLWVIWLNNIDLGEHLNRASDRVAKLELDYVKLRHEQDQVNHIPDGPLVSLKNPSNRVH